MNQGDQRHTLNLANKMDMHRFYLILFSFLITQTPSFSQGSVHGRIVDSTGAPVSYSTLAVLNKSDSSIVKGGLSDETGTYSFVGIKPGSYLFKIISIGFEEKYSASFLVDSTSSTALADIPLRLKGTYLKDVSVGAIRKTVEFKNGNIYVNVENSPLAKGNTVYDLLYKLPGVTIENETVTVQGKSGVVIMIDGRPQQVSNQQLINLLKGMSAETVERIEILKNPPVKYDASGTSGMINIKTKKAGLMGFSGSASSSVSQGFYTQSLTGLTLNYKMEKLTFYSSFNYRYATEQAIDQFNSKIGSPQDLTLFNSKTSRVGTGFDADYKLGADWNVNKKNTFGFKITGDPGNGLLNGAGANTVGGVNNMGFDHLTSGINQHDSWNLTNYSITADHLFDTSGTALNFSSDYTLLKEVQSGYNENRFFDPSGNEVLPANIYRSSNNASTQIISGKLDFNKSINDSSTFESGLKYSVVSSANDYLFERKNDSSDAFYTDPTLTNNYKYTETTEAAYANYTKTGKKYTYQAGLRAENTVLSGNNPTKNFELSKTYFNLFPNVSIDYNRSENHNFQLNINRRIDRPQYDQLNPFRVYRDQYSYFQGNPYLLPHYSNNIELTYSYKKSIVNSLSYSRIEGYMMGYTVQSDTTKVLSESIVNIRYSEAYTYSLTYQHQIKPWWEVSANIVCSYLTYKGLIQNVPLNTSGLYFNGYMTNTLILPKAVKLEITGLFRGPRQNGMVVIHPMGMLSIAIKKDFFDNKLSCSLAVNDVFYTMTFHTSSNFANQNWNYYTSFDTRRFVISLNYNFGKLELKTSEKNGDEQEKERLRH
jgi:iron complex outermembrane receptor protein